MCQSFGNQTWSQRVAAKCNVTDLAKVPSGFINLVEFIIMYIPGYTYDNETTQVLQ